jgi:hypothetical protein
VIGLVASTVLIAVEVHKLVRRGAHDAATSAPGR